MINFRKIENLFQSKRNTLFLIFFLILFQLISSFIFPSYDVSNPYWKNIKEMGFYKDYPFGYLDNLIAEKIYPLLSYYRVNLDSAANIILAHDFPQQYFQGNHTFLNRPLYAFLVYLISRPLRLISNSYALTFAAGIILNFILFFFTVFLFYLLVKNLVSLRAALLSSFLLIFSPFTHLWLVQPETNIFGAFFVILSLFLLYNYLIRSSFLRLIIFSLIIGTLILGKMLFAMPFFILLLAIFFRRYKEWFLFLIFFLIPSIFWYFLVTRVFGLNYYSGEMTDFNMYLINGWILKILQSPWQETLQTFLGALPLFISSLTFGFLLLPVIFALIGFQNFNFKNKNIICLSFIFSFFSLFFAMNYYTPRLSFLLFPIILPLSILGMDKIAECLKKYKNQYAPLFYLLVFLFLIIISSINIYKIFPYDIQCCSWLY